MNKSTSNRRKAIKCELIEKSTSNPGYFKYMITIQEKDGQIHTEPAYGFDMQDAIRRLVRSENADMIVKVVEKKQSYFILALFACCIIIPVTGVMYTKENLWLFIPLLIIVVVFIAGAIIEKYQSRE